jgi:hypothetical protein
LGVFSKDFNQVHYVLYYALDQTGEYKVINQGNIIKVYKPNNWLQSNVGNWIGTPTLDIFSYRYNKKTKYIELTDSKQRAKWPNASHHVSNFYKEWWSNEKELKKVQYGPLTLYSPWNPRLYLDGMYPEWKTHAVIDVRLSAGDKTKKIKVRLDDFNLVDEKEQNFV